MKPNYHNTDMDFRVLPSAIPLASPSPDKKNANNIAATISPSPIMIKKNITPLKYNRSEKENQKFNPDRSTDLKYATHSPGMDYSSALHEKEEIIRNLKNIIDLITDNGRKGTHDERQDNDLKKQVKILTIQNQKLVNIIEKMSKRQSKPQESTKVQQRYEKQIESLMKTMKVKKEEFEDEQKQIKKLYKALNVHCKSVENQKKQLEMENQKLLKILKDKNQTDKKINEKSRISDLSEPQNQKSPKSQKITLLKIKQQYMENMKMLRDGLVKQIQETFDTMRIALQGLGSKVSHLTLRLQSIQNITWKRIRKSDSDVDKNVGKQEEGPLIPISKNTRKSQIYIEEGPDSSQPSHRTSKDQFSQIIEGSRSSSNEMREQLAKTKAQLEQLRFKYEKVCLDTSTVSYSKRDFTEKQYIKLLDTMEQKDKQIQILYSQIKSIQKENLEKSRLKYQQWEEIKTQKQIIIMDMKEAHLQQMEEIRNLTQIKVKMLVENYEKQIEFLKKQIILKNTDLHEVNHNNNLTQSDSGKKIQQLMLKINQMQKNIQQTNSKLQIAENKLNQREIQQSMTRQSWEREKGILQKKCGQIEQMNQTERVKRQEIQQQVILQMVELSQYKREAEQSKLQAEERFAEIQNLNKQILGLGDKTQKIQQQIIIKNSEIQGLKKILMQCKKDDIMIQINQIKNLVEAKSSLKSKNSKLNRQEQEAIFQISDKLDEELSEVKQSLLEKQEKCIRQQAKLIELEGLCELNRIKFQQLQSLHLQLLVKFKQTQLKLQQVQTQQDQQCWEELLEKIHALKQLEQDRLKEVNCMKNIEENRES